MSKSVLDVNNDQMEKYDTKNNTYAMFPVGSRIQVICKAQDFSFFKGIETGEIIKNENKYLTLIVKFDDIESNGYWRNRTFNFEPSDLIILRTKSEFTKEYIRICEKYNMYIACNKQENIIQYKEENDDVKEHFLRLLLGKLLMGYTTDFVGKFEFNSRLDDETYNLLKGLANTRRMARNIEGYGIEGEFYFNPNSKIYGQEEEENIINYNLPPKTQPHLYLQWIPSEDRKYLEWDGNEKFHDYLEWLYYIIHRILISRCYTLNGTVAWQGEAGEEDRGIINVVNNHIHVIYQNNTITEFKSDNPLVTPILLFKERSW